MKEAEELQAVLEALRTFCEDREDSKLMLLALERAIQTIDVGLRDAPEFDITEPGNPKLILDAVLPYRKEVTDGDPALGEYIRAELQLFLSREQATVLFEQVEAAFEEDSDNGEEACARLSLVVDVRVQAVHERDDMEKVVRTKDGGYISENVELDLVPRIRDAMKESVDYVWPLRVLGKDEKETP